MSELNFVKPDFQAEAAEVVRFVKRAMADDLAIKFVTHALGQAYAEGGIKATDLIKHALFDGGQK